LKLTCNLSSAHAVSETATPLGQRKKKNSKCEKVCHRQYLWWNTQKHAAASPVPQAPFAIYLSSSSPSGAALVKQKSNGVMMLDTAMLVQDGGD
jgi:hypothetical protein